MIQFFRCVLLVGFSWLFAVASLQAGQYWTGAVSNDMNDPANWQDGVMPSPWAAVNTGTAELNSDWTGGDLQYLFASDGVIKIGANLTFNGNMLLASDAGTSGAVYQTAGTLTANTGFGQLGIGGNAYYKLSGGSFISQYRLGIGGVNGTGAVVDQTGGTMQSGGFYLGGFRYPNDCAATLATYNLSGGQLINTTDDALYVGFSGNAVLNVSGLGEVHAAKDICMGYDDGYYGGGTGVINLGAVGTGGGLISTTNLRKMGTAASTLNFHGGTLQITDSNTVLEGISAYVHSEGATIDVTAGKSATVAAGLLAPQAGNGLTGVAATIVGGSSYIGAPAVVVHGEGTGATASATIDPVTGQLTGVYITNPGSGYNAETTTFELLGGLRVGGTAGSATDISVAANTSGGFTKTGLGTLRLRGNCTYTGTTTVHQGTLALIDINMDTSGIVVESAGTLAGTMDWYSAPATNVLAGGTVAPGTPGAYFAISTLNLANTSNLKFTFDAGNVDTLSVDGDVTSAGPITVNVSYSGLAVASTLLSVSGNLSSNISFQLPGGLPVLDSLDAKQAAGAALNIVTGLGGHVDLTPAGPIADPAWSNAAGGNWSMYSNWGDGPIPVSGNQRAMFTGFLSGAIPVTLDVLPQLSSIIFDSPVGGSYTITPTGGNFITLHSTTATDWHISVLAGEHTVATNIKMAAGTGQSAIRLADGSHLTLSGVLSDETTTAGVNFEGNFNSGAGMGVLTLSGANTYTGPTKIRSGVLEVPTLTDAGSASTLGASNADASNLVFNGGTLKYTGDAAATTNRGFFVAGNAVIQTDKNVTFSGTVSSNPDAGVLVKSGVGALSLTNATSNVNLQALTVDQGSLNLSGDETTKPSYTVELDTLIGQNSHAAALNLANVNIHSGDNAWSWTKIGSGSGNSGYLSINNGANITSGAALLSIGEKGGNGVIDQTGGNLQIGLYAILGDDTGATPLNSWGVYNMTGGTAAIDNIYHWGFNIGAGSGAGILSIGGTAQMTVPATTLLALYSTSTGIVNLGTVGSGGGVLAIKEMGQGQSTGPGYLNFHGGTLQALADNEHFLSANAQLAGIYIYNEGAKIDSNDKAVTIDSNLLAPNGDGVASIALTSHGSGYIGAPVVQITTNGSGTGATARAVMIGDQVDYIEITNPGTGYSSSDTLIVNLVGGLNDGGTSATVGTIGLVDNTLVAGGLTKLGDGTLTLTGALSYQGDTFVNEGTLTITTALNTPDAAVSVAAGATLNAVSIVADSLNIGVSPLPVVTTIAVPEPATLLLLALAGLTLVGASFRLKQRID